MRRIRSKIDENLRPKTWGALKFNIGSSSSKDRRTAHFMAAITTNLRLEYYKIGSAFYGFSGNRVYCYH